MKILLVIIMALSSLQGCSWFTRPLDKPVIEEKLNPSFFSDASVGTLSLTPERRVVLVNFSNNRFCAEAPTEIGIDVSKFYQGLIEASKGDQAKAGAQATAAIANQNSVLNKRTQGMQLFLANSYFTCQMYLNGGIDERQLLEMQVQTLSVVEPLIRAELEYMYTAEIKKEAPEANKIDVQAIVNKILEQKSAKPEEAPKKRVED